MTHVLTPGSPAPALDLPATGGRRAVLSRGRRTVVYFYPKAKTAGCTTEACDFRDSLEVLSLSGYDVVGVSPDAVPVLEEFARENGLTFPLGSDDGSATAQAWGAYGEKVKDGATVMGVVRSTVVVDEEGTVIEALYGVDPVGHVADLRERLGLG